jgi:hypothetical protein
VDSPPTPCIGGPRLGDGRRVHLPERERDRAA